MATTDKRKTPPSQTENAGKRQKRKKFIMLRMNSEQTKGHWKGPRRGGHPPADISALSPGTAGIWATCDKGREAKCVGELRDLFEEYAEKLYGDQRFAHNVREAASDDEPSLDVEDEIEGELSSMRKPSGLPIFQNVRIDVQCVIFFKTRQPVEPVSFVHTICKEAMATGLKRTRFVKRLTPISSMGRANEKDLEALATSRLAGSFHNEDQEKKTFAIRPTLRNHDKTLTRDTIIQQVATLVGQAHKVDLTKPDLTILVEVYKSVCGMAIVGSDYEELKRYNLDQIYAVANSDGDNNEDAKE